MKWTTPRQNLAAGSDVNVIELRSYRQKFARERRRAWWAWLLLGVMPRKGDLAKPTLEVRRGAVLKFRT